MTAFHSSTSSPFYVRNNEYKMDLSSEMNHGSYFDETIDIDIDYNGGSEGGVDDDNHTSESHNASMKNPSLYDQNAQQNNDVEREDYEHGQSVLSPQKTGTVQSSGIADGTESPKKEHVDLSVLNQLNPDAQIILQRKDQEIDFEDQSIRTSYSLSSDPDEDTPYATGQHPLITDHKENDVVTETKFDNFSADDTTPKESPQLRSIHYQNVNTSENLLSKVDTLSHSKETINLPAVNTSVVSKRFQDEKTNLSPSESEFSQTSYANEGIISVALSSDASSYLHSVSVLYQNDRYSLFPPAPRDEHHYKTYFFQDLELADSNLSTLYSAMRPVLGDNIAEQDELVMNFENLELEISETHAELFPSPLRSLVDIYVHLQRNDGVDQPPPFSIDLTSRTRPSYQLDFLANAAAEGKGFSEIVLSPLHAGGPTNKANYFRDGRNEGDEKKSDALDVEENSDIYDQTNENTAEEKVEGASSNDSGLEHGRHFKANLPRSLELSGVSDDLLDQVESNIPDEVSTNNTGVPNNVLSTNQDFRSARKEGLRELSPNTAEMRDTLSLAVTVASDDIIERDQNMKDSLGSITSNEKLQDRQEYSTQDTPEAKSIRQTDAVIIGPTGPLHTPFFNGGAGSVRLESEHESLEEANQEWDDLEDLTNDEETKEYPDGVKVDVGVPPETDIANFEDGEGKDYLVESVDPPTAKDFKTDETLEELGVDESFPIEDEYDERSRTSAQSEADVAHQIYYNGNSDEISVTNDCILTRHEHAQQTEKVFHDKDHESSLLKNDSRPTEDEDEISYEEDDEIISQYPFAQQELDCEQKAASSPRSLKRSSDLLTDESAPRADLQDSKRTRLD